MKAESMKQVVDMLYPNLDETMAELKAKEEGKNMKWEELCDKVRELLPEEEYGSVMVKIETWTFDKTNTRKTTFLVYSTVTDKHIIGQSPEGLITAVKLHIESQVAPTDSGIEI